MLSCKFHVYIKISGDIFAHGVHRLGTLFNAIPGKVKKYKVEEWAAAHYVSVWEELNKLGRWKDRYGHELFNIDRYVKA